MDEAEPPIDMRERTDRIDPRPPKRIYRWDLDKTCLQTEFDTFRQLVRTALQNAGSIASLMLTTEALVSELPEEKKAPAGGGHGGGGMEGMY